MKGDAAENGGIPAGSGFTSARLLTKGLREFTYGRIEARITPPRGQGVRNSCFRVPGVIH